MQDEGRPLEKLGGTLRWRSNLVLDSRSLVVLQTHDSQPSSPSTRKRRRSRQQRCWPGYAEPPARSLRFGAAVGSEAWNRDGPGIQEDPPGIEACVPCCF